jgi:hypothetical protein
MLRITALPNNAVVTEYFHKMCCNMGIGRMGSIPSAMPVLVMCGCLENFHNSTRDEIIALSFMLFEKFSCYRQTKAEIC